MADTDAQLIQKVEAKQKELVALYGLVYEALCRIDREGYKASDLAQLDRALDPPGNIPPAKAIAVLKAIMGSTPEDKQFRDVPWRAVRCRSISGFICRSTGPRARPWLP
jgi:hypothetical protein